MASYCSLARLLSSAYLQVQATCLPQEGMGLTTKQYCCLHVAAMDGKAALAYHALPLIIQLLG